MRGRKVVSSRPADLRESLPMTSSTPRPPTYGGVLEGPLRGHHRLWYVVRADGGEGGDGELADLGRLKVGEPREGVLWYDRRSFPSEEALLAELPRLGVPRVPPVRRAGAGGPAVHGFIEGSTLGELAPADDHMSARHLDQIVELFRALARVRPGDLPPAVTGDGAAAPGADDSAGFLGGLLRHTRERCYEERRPEYGWLFDRLGVPPHAFDDASPLGARAARLTPRPYCLLHGDLHRENLIVAPDDALWTIDWELAALGDPLYDLATHLHLTRYPPDQEREVTARWHEVMARELPGATAGTARDLDCYLRFKRAQSVCTDVVRHAVAVREAPPAERAGRLALTAKAVHRVLARAEEALGLTGVPGPGAVEEIYDALPSAHPHA
ncbi:phosphotransferase [Streptomyces sp. NPDC054784]